MNLKDLVRNNIVRFAYYRAQFFFYNLIIEESWNGMEYEEMYRFSIPLDDIGNASLEAEDKAITYMRWIRKALDNNELVKIEK